MDPSFVPARRGLAAALVQFGRIEEAIGNLTASSDDRGDPVTQAWLGHALAVQGDKAGARKIAGALVQRAERGFVPAYHLALLYAGLEELDAAFAQLDRACETRDPALDTLDVEPRFWILRGDPLRAPDGSSEAESQADAGIGQGGGPVGRRMRSRERDERLEHVNSTWPGQVGRRGELTHSRAEVAPRHPVLGLAARKR
jgi:hypothetical protein